METMQHYIKPLPGATWSPRHFGNGCNRFVDQLVEKINSGMESGQIYPFNSPNIILMFTQPKKDSKNGRFLLNAVDRNKAVRDTIVEMTNARMIIDWMEKFKFRVIMDLIDGYDNIRLHSDSEKYSTFSCFEGLCNTRYMQQGDKNAPATVIRAMSYLLRKFKGKNVIVDLNDILIVADTFEELVQVIRKVCQILLDNVFYLNRKKCNSCEKDYKY